MWNHTKSRSIAAAFATLGMPVKIMAMYDSLGDEAKFAYEIAAKSQCGRFDAKSLREMQSNGKLEQVYPEHPLLLIHRIFANRTALQTILNSGYGVSYEKFNNSQHHQKISPSREGLSGSHGVESIRINRLDITVSLLTSGCKLLKIEGNRGNNTFEISRFGISSEGAFDAVALIGDLNSPDSHGVNWEHPVILGVLAQRNFSKILDAEQRAEPVVLLRQKNSGRCVILEPNSSDKAWNRAKKFLH